MLLNYLRYRYVKARMTAYLDGELSDKARRFIARQIDENPRCYDDYIRARQSKQDIERHLPTFGQAEANQLDNMWAAIQAEMKQPQEKLTPIQPLQRPSYSLSYGVAVLVLAVILLTPFALNSNRLVTEPIAQQPAPEETALITSEATDAPAMVALISETDVQMQSTRDTQIPLQNTPAPRTPGY